MLQPKSYTTEFVEKSIIILIIFKHHYNKNVHELIIKKYKKTLNYSEPSKMFNLETLLTILIIPGGEPLLFLLRVLPSIHRRDTYFLHIIRNEKSEKKRIFQVVIISAEVGSSFSSKNLSVLPTVSPTPELEKFEDARPVRIRDLSGFEKKMTFFFWYFFFPVYRNPPVYFLMALGFPIIWQYAVPPFTYTFHHTMGATIRN